MNDLSFAIMIPVLHPYPETAGLLSGDLGRGGREDWGYPTERTVFSNCNGSLLVLFP